jgi:hypothetical protein
MEVCDPMSAIRIDKEMSILYILAKFREILHITKTTKIFIVKELFRRPLTLGAGKSEGH